MITEDKVRDKARNTLGLNESLKGAKADVGQLTTFKEALQKPLFPSRIEQNRSVRFFFTTSKNGVFFAIKIV